MFEVVKSLAPLFTDIHRETLILLNSVQDFTEIEA